MPVLNERKLPKSTRHKQTQKKNTEPYINIPKRTLACDEYTDLSPQAKAVFGAFLYFFRNDQPETPIPMPYSMISKLSKVKGKATVSRCLKELKDKQFIFLAKKGGLEHNPSTYKINKKYTTLYQYEYAKKT